MADATLRPGDSDGLPVAAEHERPHVTDEGSKWFAELYELFAPIREQAESFTENEINEAIDEAIRESRAARGYRR